MVRRQRTAVLAAAMAVFMTGGAGAQQVETADKGPSVDIGAYLRNGVSKPDTLSDNPRYPGITIRNDPNNNSAFFSKFGGDTHRLRASRGPGIFSIFGFR